MKENKLSNAEREKFECFGAAEFLQEIPNRCIFKNEMKKVRKLLVKRTVFFTTLREYAENGIYIYVCVNN